MQDRIFEEDGEGKVIIIFYKFYKEAIRVPYFSKGEDHVDFLRMGYKGLANGSAGVQERRIEGETRSLSISFRLSSKVWATNCRDPRRGKGYLRFRQ